jgi:hypothetical protein
MAWEPETVNRKGLLVRSFTTLKKWFEWAVLSFRNALETQNRCLEVGGLKGPC